MAQSLDDFLDDMLGEIYTAGAAAWPEYAVPEWRHMTKAQRQAWYAFINNEFSIAQEENEASQSRL